MPRVSVIVPAYNVGHELDRCLRSICGQTERDMEILCVYTPSRDATLDILRAWADRDARIQILVREGGGLGGARNTGIDRASGSYIAFVDSDDWIDADMIETLYRAARAHGAQIAECGFRTVYADRVGTERACTCAYSEAEPPEAVRELIRWRRFKCVAWNKLYARGAIGDIRYPEGRLHEDEFTTYKYFYNARRLVCVGAVKYNYNRTRENSLSRAPFHDGCMDVCFAARERAVFLEERAADAPLCRAANDAYVWLSWDRLRKAAAHGVEGPKTAALLDCLKRDAAFFSKRAMSVRYRIQLVLLAKAGMRCFALNRRLGTGGIG